MNWITILIIFLLIIFIASGVIITSSSINLYALKDTDEDFKNAYYYSTWAAVLTWVLVALAIILTGLYIYYSVEVPEAALTSALKPESNTGIDTIICLIILLLLITTIGILAAKTAYYIGQSSNYNSNIPQQYNAREEAIITAVLCLGSGGLLFIWFITDLIYNFYSGSETNNKESKIINKK